MMQKLIEKNDKNLYDRKIMKYTYILILLLWKEPI